MRCTDWQFLVTVTVPKDGKYYFRAFIKSTAGFVRNSFDNF